MKENQKRVPEIMLADDPMEQREQIMRDSCDQIVEKFYTRKFSTEEVQGKRAEYCEVGMKKSALEKELREVSADLKGKIKPLKERQDAILDEIKQGGEQVQGDTFKFVFEEIGKVGFYDTNGYLVEERDMTPEERQRTMFQAIRKNGTEG
jgi:gas vesicle protein